MTARYQLSSLRDARARDERVQRGDLAGAVAGAHALAADVARIAARAERLRAALSGAGEARALALARGATAGALAQIERYERRLRADLDDALDEQLRAEAHHRGQLDAVDVARERLVLAHARREVIERHFARWRAEQRKLAERRED